VSLEDGREPRVDALRERERLLAREGDARGALRDRPRRAGRERPQHLLGGRHLRELRNLERDLADLRASCEVVVG
jgi:hypothetical protein